MNFVCNKYSNLLNFWKKIEQPAERNTGKASFEQDVKIEEKAKKIMSEQVPAAGKQLEGKNTVGQLKQIFESQREQPLAHKQAPKKIEIPNAFLKDSVLQANVEIKERRSLKAKEKELPEDHLSPEKESLKAIESAIDGLNQKLEENPDAEELKAVRMEYASLANRLAEGNFELPLDSLLCKLIHLEMRINAVEQEALPKILKHQPEQLSTEKELKNYTAAALERPLAELKKQLESSSELKLNDHKGFAKIEKKINEEIKKLSQEIIFFTLDSIQEDLEVLKKFLQGKVVTDVIKLSRVQVNGLTRSYTLFPDGRISVHVKEAELVRVGREIKQGVLGKGGYKKAKFMKNTETGEISVRGVLMLRMDPLQRKKMMDFMEEVKGAENILQLEYVSWKPKPKKAASLFSVKRNGAGAMREAFISKYYPFSGDKLLSLISEKKIPQPVHASIALQIAKGVQTMHQKGWVHRDIKPDNIFIQWDAADPEKAKAVIADFDTVHKNDDRAETGTTLGTPGYIPLEYGIEEEVTDARPADVYALGVSLLEMFISHGPAPWKGNEKDRVQLIYLIAGDRYSEALEDLRKNARTPFEHLILDMCHKHPSERPTIEKVVERLEQIQKD